MSSFPSPGFRAIASASTHAPAPSETPPEENTGRTPRLEAEAENGFRSPSPSAGVRLFLERATQARIPLVWPAPDVTMREAQGVWAFLPFGSQALRSVEASPAVRLGRHAKHAPMRLTDLPMDVLSQVAAHLPVPDLCRLASVNRALQAQFWLDARRAPFANRIARWAWNNEQLRPAARTLFSRETWHTLHDNVFPSVDTFYLPKGYRRDYSVFSRLFPNVVALDAREFDERPPFWTELPLQLHDALVHWPKVHRVFGNRTIVPTLEKLSTSSCSLQQYYEIGTCSSRTTRQRLLAPVSHQGQPVSRSLLQPWLRSSPGRDDPYTLLDLIGIERLTMALPCVDGQAPAPTDWLRLYSDDVRDLTWSTGRKVLSRHSDGRSWLPFRIVPVFFRDQRHQVHLRKELKERIPGLEAVSSEEDMLRAAQGAPQRMARSDAHALVAFVHALLTRLRAGTHPELRTAAIGCALPFFSFASFNVPVLQELGVLISTEQLLMRMWHCQVLVQSVTPYQCVRELFAEAPQIQLSFLLPESTLHVRRARHHEQEGVDCLFDASVPVRSLVWAPLGDTSRGIEEASA